MRNWLIDLRHKMGISEAEAASRLGIKQPHYHRIEHGEGNPSVPLAMKIGKLYRVSWVRLFEEKKGA